MIALGCGTIVRHLTASHYRSLGEKHLQSGVEGSIWAGKETGQNQYTPIQHLQIANERLDRAAALFPGDGEILFNQGKTLFYLGPRYQNQALERILRAKETYCVPDLFQILTHIYVAQLKFNPARLNSNLLLLIDPEREGAQFLAGRIDFLSEHYEDAMNHFRQELRVDPENESAWEYIGRIYERHFHQYEAAAQAYEKSIVLAPQRS